MKIINLCFACMLAVASLAQTTLPEAVVESIQNRIDFGMNPSIAIGILDEDGMHYFNYGVTKAGGTAVDEHTIYEIGSITKTFTAILLADATLKDLVAYPACAMPRPPRTRMRSWRIRTTGWCAGVSSIPLPVRTIWSTIASSRQRQRSRTTPRVFRLPIGPETVEEA
jgi:hypothetical protein